MCRRKRSRPSSKRRLTKNVKRLSSGRSVCASAIGVVDEHRLRTNGAALLASAAVSLAPALVRTEAKLAVAVITSPKPTRWTRSQGLRWFARREECERSRLLRDRGSPAVIGTSRRPVALRPRLSTGLPLSLSPKCQSVAVRSQAPIMCRGSHVRFIRVARAMAATFYVSPWRRRRHATIPEAPCAHQMPRIEAAAAQIPVPDGQAGARRVDEAAAAGIDTDVIDAARADAEKYQVPGRKLSQRHRVRRALLLHGGARNGQTCALVHVQRQPAAVEAGRVGTAEVVRGSDQGFRRLRDRGPALRTGRGRRRKEAAARGEQQCDCKSERGAQA